MKKRSFAAMKEWKVGDIGYDRAVKVEILEIFPSSEKGQEKAKVKELKTSYVAFIYLKHLTEEPPFKGLNAEE